MENLTTEELLAELADLRRRLAECEADCAELGRTKEALRESHEELQAIYDGMVDGLLVADAETKHFVGCNAAIGRMTGYSEEELLSMSVMALHPSADLAHVLEAFEALVEGRLTGGQECPVLRKDGTVFQADVSVGRITYRGRRCVIGFFRDITERKQTQEALRESLDQLETIYDGMVEGLRITDAATRQFVRVNSSLCRMLGYTEDELLRLSIKDIHPPGEVPNDLRRFQAAAEGQVSINEDRPVLRKDGTIFYADITGHPILFDGRHCLLALFRDVTERRQAQIALNRERHTLRQMLRASDHERQLIAYDIHDGLAQQLAAGIMQFQTYEALKEQQPVQARTAYDAGLQMLRQGHYEARRLISGVRPPILDESGITAAVAYLVYEHQTPAGPIIEFQHQMGFKRLPSILENALYRIAQESLANACKYSHSDKVRVSLMQGEMQVRLEVRDWGIGFDPKSVVGEHFGLEGMVERARLLGGHLRIESQADEGTLISVTLPLPVDQEEQS